MNLAKSVSHKLQTHLRLTKAQFALMHLTTVQEAWIQIYAESVYFLRIILC